MRKGVWIIALVAVLSACQKTKPQRPTFQGQTNVDTTMVQLITLNQQMADQADVQLARVAGEGYVLMDENYWVKGLYPQKEGIPLLQTGEYIDYKAEFFSMKGHLLITHQVSAKLGQIEEIRAITNVLSYMQHGQGITMLVPWYLAFGSAGNVDVPPYENIRVELSVQ